MTTLLTQFSSQFSISITLKTFGFLTFSGGVEMEHCPKMGSSKKQI